MVAGSEGTHEVCVDLGRALESSNSEGGPRGHRRTGGRRGGLPPRGPGGLRSLARRGRRSTARASYTGDSGQLRLDGHNRLQALRLQGRQPAGRGTLTPELRVDQGASRTRPGEPWGSCRSGWTCGRWEDTSRGPRSSSSTGLLHSILSTGRRKGRTPSA